MTSKVKISNGILRILNKYYSRSDIKDTFEVIYSRWYKRESYSSLGSVSNTLINTLYTQNYVGTGSG